MKKSFAFAVLAALALAAPSFAGVIRVGATPTPHGEVLEQVVDDLKAKGVELKIVEFTDYVTPNLAVADGEIEANYFQHLPYLESFCSDRGLNLVPVASIHIEPMGIFSKKIGKLEDLANGASIAIPNDPTNGGRALLLLQSAGLIQLAEGAGLTATELDVDKNPHNFKFRSLEAAQLPRSLDDVDAAIINGNYALAAGLNPVSDSLLLEGSDSPYVNVLVVKAGDESNPDVRALVEALGSQKVKDFIAEKYAGAVVSAYSVMK